MLSEIGGVIGIFKHIVDAVPFLRDRVKKADYASKGKDLLAIYLRGNMMLKHGELLLRAITSLLDELERAERLVAAHPHTRESLLVSIQNARGRLLSEIGDQIDRVDELYWFASESQFVLWVVDPAFVDELHKNIGHKGSRLFNLYCDVRDRNEYLIAAHDQRLSLTEATNADTVRTLQRYRDSRKGREFLDDLGSHLQRLRAAILEHFKLEDILLDVDDRRFNRQDNQRRHLQIAVPSAGR